MIVGVDATSLAGHMSGVGYYTARLIEGIGAGADRGIVGRLLLLSNRAIRAPSSPRIEVCRQGRFPVRAAWMQLVLPLLLRRIRPDLVHYTNYLAPVLGQTPYVVSIHDMSLALLPQLHTLRKRALMSTLVPYCARKAQIVLTPSEATRRDVERLLGIPGDRIKVIPYAAGPEFRPTPDRRPARAHVGDAPYLLHVGTIEPRKNLVRVLRAFARVVASLPDHRFLVVGQPGWLYEDVLRELARPELQGRVVMAGYVQEAQLPALYSGADAFVYASLYEGFGLPVVEAMACGAPVITSSTSSLAELAGDAASLVDPEDEAMLSEAMRRLCTDGTLRADLARRGRARAATFSWERTAAATAEAYAQALDRTRRRASSR
ncbi:MAG TPA: glycosyltransferase family 1 protein [Vicinamibacteria bacterium]|nr:glycosyltransferase family 1 protein [Vicinamibacteria bacterium]